MTAYHKSPRAHTPMEAFDADKAMHANFINGSRALLDAIVSGYGPHRFLWSSAGSAATWKPASSAAKMANSVNLIRKREEFAESLRVSREPCRVCGTRGDIGCKHKRVA